MDANTSIDTRAAELATVLRRIESEPGPVSAEERRARLIAACEEALAGLSPESRRQVIAKLGSHATSSGIRALLGALHAGDAPADADLLVARIIQLARDLTPSQRQAVAEAMRIAGSEVSGPSASAAVPESPAQALRSALSLGARDQVDAGRSHELAVMLTDLALKLDVLMTDIWKKIAPDSPVRKSATLRVTLGRFAAGDPATSRSQAEQELALLRQLTAGVASAISRAAPQYAKKHIDRFGAAEIERLVREEGGGWGLDARCWKRYQQVCSTMDAEAIEHELLGMIAEHTEKLIRGTR